ncbi:MAG: hypothetical protein AB1540_11240 [Bdellovibrionota bacterium]
MRSPRSKNSILLLIGAVVSLNLVGGCAQQEGASGFSNAQVGANFGAVGQTGTDGDTRNNNAVNPPPAGGGGGSQDPGNGAGGNAGGSNGNGSNGSLGGIDGSRVTFPSSGTATLPRDARLASTMPLQTGPMIPVDLGLGNNGIPTAPPANTTTATGAGGASVSITLNGVCQPRGQACGYSYSGGYPAHLQKHCQINYFDPNSGQVRNEIFYTDCGSCTEAALMHAATSGAPVFRVSGLQCFGTARMNDFSPTLYRFSVETLLSGSACAANPEFFGFQNCMAN